MNESVPLTVAAAHLNEGPKLVSGRSTLNVCNRVFDKIKFQL